MRIILLVSGILLCAGGLIVLAAASAVEGSHVAGGEVFFILISVVPGICLMVAGILMEKSKRSRLLDIAVLILSIVWLFALTAVPLVVEMP